MSFFKYTGISKEKEIIYDSKVSGLKRILCGSLRLLCGSWRNFFLNSTWLFF